MFNRWLALFNAVGVMVLIALAVIQWRHDRAQHEQFAEEHKHRAASETALAEARQRVSGLEGAVHRMKAGLADAQKAADEASGARPQLEGQIKTLTTERDQARQGLTTWEAAVKERDARITDLSLQLREARTRLEEAIKRLEKK